MLRFSGKKLQNEDMKILREVAKFTMNKFLAPSTQKKTEVKIRLVENLNGWQGECAYLGRKGDVRQFVVNVSISKINKRAKCDIARMKEPIKTLIHELVHVKQYANNQMFDYVDGVSTRFEGRLYQNKLDYEAYWNSPWEIEAYGRTEGMFEMFMVERKKKQKAMKRM